MWNPSRAAPDARRYKGRAIWNSPSTSAPTILATIMWYTAPIPRVTAPAAASAIAPATRVLFLPAVICELTIPQTDGYSPAHRNRMRQARRTPACPYSVNSSVNSSVGSAGLPCWPILRAYSLRFSM